MVTPKRVAILGCGPAGLLAAHATLIAGHEPHIFSKKIKSAMPGTQYLHQPIPHLSDQEPDGKVMYIKFGTQQGYAFKVYGSADANCSWSKFMTGEHEIWSLGSMYQELWDTFETSITDMELSASSIPDLCNDYPLVISSIPAPRICLDPEHQFRSQTIWISEDPKDVDGVIGAENAIIYDGTDNVHWYRASRIFDKYAIETTKPMGDAGWKYGHKPIRTNCDCHTDRTLGRFFNVGRFGKWKKGVLTHNAFWDTVGIVESILGKEAA